MCVITRINFDHFISTKLQFLQFSFHCLDSFIFGIGLNDLFQHLFGLRCEIIDFRARLFFYLYHSYNICGRNNSITMFVARPVWVWELSARSYVMPTCCLPRFVLWGEWWPGWVDHSENSEWDYLCTERTDILIAITIWPIITIITFKHIPIKYDY